MTDTAKKVAVVVLNWNGLAETIECLESLHQSDYPRLEVIVVDNGSTDGSCPAIKERFPDVCLIENQSNWGFVRGNNRGMADGLERGADLLFVLNNDTILRPDCITELVNAIEGDPTIGIVGPLMQRTLRPDLVDMGGDFNFWTGDVRLRHFVLSIGGGDVQPIDYVWGCGLMVRAEVVQSIGLFAERYGAYYEDADFCMRARAVGYRTVVATRAWMVHKVGRSGEKRFLWQTHMRLRNHVLFFLSHARPHHYLSLVPALFLYQIPLMLVRAARLYLARKLMPRYQDRPISLWYRPGL